MEKKEFGTKVFTNFEDRFQYALGLALLLLVWEIFISDRRNAWWRKVNLFGHISQKKAVYSEPVSMSPKETV
jgi:Ca-activated chloride channel family protein